MKSPIETATRLASEDHTSTNVLSEILELDGIQFSWWAVDRSPSLVKVSSEALGTKSEFTHADRKDCAKKLARMILEEKKEKAAEVRARLEERDKRRVVR